DCSLLTLLHLSTTVLLLLYLLCNATAPTEIYTLSLHDALPIFSGADPTTKAALYATLGIRLTYEPDRRVVTVEAQLCANAREPEDRKSTRLNSSHVAISYAVFCLKKKKHARPCGQRSPAQRRPP